MTNLYTTPSLSGVMIESSQYQNLGVGLTDRIFILGHADNLSLNDPYQVVDAKEAVVALNSDPNSPLLRTFLEVYYAGGRDIWLVATAPMSEYQANISQRDNAYYTTYYNRLADTYALIEQWDLVQIVVPAEAPFYDSKGVDFLGQLTQHCQDSWNYTGTIRLGLLGTRTGAALSQADIDAMASDSRINNQGDPGKFVSVFVGEGIINLQEMPAMYNASVIGTVAAELASSNLKQSLVYNPLPNIISSLGRLTAAQAQQLALAKLNPIGITTRGDRGTPYQIVPLTDSTLGPTGTDYWVLGNTRLVLALLDNIRALSKRTLGIVGLGQFKQDCNNYFATLVRSGYIQSYTINIYPDSVTPSTVHVDVAVSPYIGLRTITFTATVGPGA